MRFIETPVFSADVQALIPDDEYRELQLALLLRPDAGVVIPRSGGLRKLRWGHRGGGKRGGLRIIYFWYPEDDVIYMLLAYSKTKQKDLTPEQLRILRRLVKEDLK